MDFELVKTPSCEISGLPLPILPKAPDEVRALFMEIRPKYENHMLPPDEHHHVHPKRSPLLRQSLGGKALRQCRVQDADYFVHHDLYHKTFNGPELPQTDDEMFRFTVLAVAGVLPRRAIDLSGIGEWKEVDITDRQFARISRATHIANQEPIGLFFADYAARQDIPGIMNNDSAIDEFLDMRTPNKRKREIAREMLRDSITFSLEDVRLANKHAELKEQGLLRQPKPRTFEWITSRYVRAGRMDYFQQTVSSILTAA